MNHKRYKSGGFTLVEVMAATAVLVVAVLGSSAFRYSAALSARTADEKRDAAQMALLLCESWVAAGGSATYDPITSLSSDMAMTNSSWSELMQNCGSEIASVCPVGFSQSGLYAFTLNNTDYKAILSWKDVNSGLRVLNVIIVTPQNSVSADNIYNYQRYNLTTYVAI